MRFVYFLFLLVFVAVIAIFVVENREEVPLKFSVPFTDFSRELGPAPLSLVLVGAYFLGMLSGWTVVGFVKRSFERVTEAPPPPPQQRI